MGRLSTLQQDAARKYRLANHMLTQTYPLVKDSRLLLAVVEHLLSALETSMLSLLHIELYYNRIPQFGETFDSRFNAFRYHIVDKYHINREFLLFIKDMQDIIKWHKESPVEFARKDKFVICTNNYRTLEVTSVKVKKYVMKSKEFIDTINSMVGKYGAII